MVSMRALSLDSIPGTFIASLRSIGTAMTMASVGYYLHQTDSIGSEGKRALALLSQQITVPLFLFTKIIFCNQDWSDKPCPDVTQSIADVWMLLFWPIYVVGVGLLIGLIVAKATNTPKHHVRSVLAACAFGNSTGLPITLLNVIHSNFPSTSDLGRIDPTLFLSVFLLLYPILLWGLGGWLLAPDEENSVNTAPPPVIQNDQVASSQMNGKNSTETSFLVTGAFLNGVRRRRLSGADEGHYLSEHELRSVQPENDQEQPLRVQGPMTGEPSASILSKIDLGQGKNVPADDDEDTVVESVPLLGTVEAGATVSTSMLENFRKVSENCFQPPVIGAVAGIICASIPKLRGLFVDLDDRDSDAPLQFLFDGLYAVGQTAVPINMMILGCNLSSASLVYMASHEPLETNTGILSMCTMVGIVIGKMVIMPCIGILSAWILKTFVLNIPEDIAGAFYLVLMIVFLTPTANNVMLMVELSGSGAKEGMASVIALQYLVAPIVLSCTMTIAIGVASGWSS